MASHLISQLALAAKPDDAKNKFAACVKEFAAFSKNRAIAGVWLPLESLQEFYSSQGLSGARVADVVVCPNCSTPIGSKTQEEKNGACPAAATRYMARHLAPTGCACRKPVKLSFGLPACSFIITSASPKKINTYQMHRKTIPDAYTVKQFTPLMNQRVPAAARRGAIPSCRRLQRAKILFGCR